MKNILILSAVLLIMGFSIWKGIGLDNSVPPTSSQPSSQSDVPSIGRIEVLNGCGRAGSARVVADYLRKKRFDVKNVGNAANWNFPQTIVISRVIPTSIAEQVAEALGTRHTVIIRTPENPYDVTVIVGPDYAELVN